MVVITPKETLCLMKPLFDESHITTCSKHAPLLQGAWADEKGVLLKVKKRRFAFRLRETAPGSAPFGIYIYIYIYMYVYIYIYI